jgi:hypothetical protein
MNTATALPVPERHGVNRFDSDPALRVLLIRRAAAFATRLHATLVTGQPRALAGGQRAQAPGGFDARACLASKVHCRMATLGMVCHAMRWRAPCLPS